MHVDSKLIIGDEVPYTVNIALVVAGGVGIQPKIDGL